GDANPWFVLCRDYTGHKGIFHVLLLILCFLVPNVVRLFYWSSPSQAELELLQSVAQDLTNSLDERAVDLSSRARQLPIHPVRSFLGASMRPWPGYWQAVREFIFWGGLAVAVLYNLARAVFLWGIPALGIWGVGPLRDEELRSGYTPAWRDYRLLAHLHPWMQRSFYVIYGFFVLSLVSWIVPPHLLPG